MLDNSNGLEHLAKSLQGVKTKETILQMVSVREWLKDGTIAYQRREFRRNPEKGIIQVNVRKVAMGDDGDPIYNASEIGVCDNKHYINRRNIIKCNWFGCSRKFCTVRGCSWKITINNKHYCFCHGLLILLGFGNNVMKRNRIIKPARRIIATPADIITNYHGDNAIKNRVPKLKSGNYASRKG